MNKRRAELAKGIFESWNPSAQEKLKQYIRLFPEQYEKFKDSQRAKIKGLNENDLFALGRTFEQQMMTQQINEEASFAQLGAQPTLAYDFITAMFGKSVIPYIASEQVIDEMQGLVYFENIIAQGIKRRMVTPNGEAEVPVYDKYFGRGNIEPGDVLGRAAGVPDKYPRGYAGEMVYGQEIAATAGTTLAVTIPGGNVRPNYLKVKFAKAGSDETFTITYTATDDGKGNVVGVGMYGTVDYATGALNLTLGQAATTNDKLVIDYAVNFELSELPSITTELDSKFIRANVYGLQTDTSIISRYAMGKRFNFDMQERAVQLLQENILNEITTELVLKIANAASEIGSDLTTFNMAVPVGVSQQAHYNSVDYTFGVIAQKMAQRSGKGTLSVALAGPSACAFLTQLGKFKRIGEATAFATVYGVYDNTTIVIRCPQLQGEDDDAIYFVHKGESPFEAAAVYAPYMPLVGVEDLPVPTALLNRRSAVASMAAVDVLVPGFVQKFKLVNNPAALTVAAMVAPQAEDTVFKTQEQ